jgi:hypothetical protein
MPFVDQLRQSPYWGAQEAFAHTLIYDATMMGDYRIPSTASSADVPALVLDGATTPWLTAAADGVAEALPNAQRRTLPGQQHNVAPDAIAPVLAESLAA